MREMKEKFGAEVGRFRYAFVLPSHAPGWDQPVPEAAAILPTPSLPAVGSGSPPASGRHARYIDVKPRRIG